MKRPQPHWLFDSKLSHTEVLSSLFFFFVEFVKEASPDDVAFLLRALADWSEHPKDEGWFATSMYQLCGVPTQKLLNKPALTLHQLRTKARDYLPKDRAAFIGAHLDLVHADHDERAFLTVCQKLVRQEIKRPSDGRKLRIEKLLHEASNIMSDDVLGAPPQRKPDRGGRRSSKPALQATPSASRAKKTATAA